MFKFMERALRQRQLNKIPFGKKIRVLQDCIDKVLNSVSGVNIPAFQRSKVVMNYIQSKRLVDYYFENRSQIPVLCEQLQCL